MQIRAAAILAATHAILATNRALAVVAATNKLHHQKQIRAAAILAAIHATLAINQAIAVVAVTSKRIV
jgi:hypothetical protein